MMRFSQSKLYSPSLSTNSYICTCWVSLWGQPVAFSKHQVKGGPVWLEEQIEGLVQNYCHLLYKKCSYDILRKAFNISEQVNRLK